MPLIKTSFRAVCTTGSCVMWAYVIARSAQGLYYLSRDGIDLITGKDRHAL